MEALPVIGKHELIHLHKEGIFNVPAKIDTGADKCAIWASGIEEENGVLRFSFFGPGSALYTGEKVETSEYVSTPVKNSFGVTELRFMVRLSIILGDKKYRVRFTLADRSKNKFPVLLGMNFLKNRFWVNVAENYIQSPEKNPRKREVLIVCAAREERWQTYFKKVQALHSQKTKYTVVGLDDLVYWFGRVPKITLGVDGKDIKEFPLAYFKLYKLGYEQRVAAADYLRYQGCRVIDEELLGSASTSKLSEMVRMNCHSLPLPKGVAMATAAMKNRFELLKKELDLPFVLKDVYSDKGQNNFLIESKASFLEILETADPALYFVAQQFIPNDGFVRLLVLNKDVPVAISRVTHEHDNPLKKHLNKPRGSVNASLVKPKDLSEIRSLAMRTSTIMNRQVVGVDAIQDKHTKKWYILEANVSPQMTGDKYEDEKAAAFAKFIDYELERS